MKRGFTLIELLVVIAIIGILSSVVLASLNSARAKGTDASIKGQLAGARAQAEIYYDAQNPTSYSGVCDATAGILPMWNALKANSATTTCFDNGTVGWAMSAQLKSNTNQWCVDNTGYSGTTTKSVATLNATTTCQ